jgi:hypothetical protein
MGPESTAVGNNTGLTTLSNIEQASHGPQQAIEMEPSPPYIEGPKKGERSRSGQLNVNVELSGSPVGQTIHESFN